VSDGFNGPCAATDLKKTSLVDPGLRQTLRIEKPHFDGLLHHLVAETRELSEAFADNDQCQTDE
jgi:hypothetical protein